MKQKRNHMPDLKKQKGVSTYLIFMIIVIVLGISLALNTLILSRFRAVSRAGRAVAAFYAADAGAEQVLYEINHPMVGPPKHLTSGDFSSWADINATYRVVTTCNPEYDCSLTCPSCPDDSECYARRFCIVSQGNYDDTQRAIRVKY